MANQRKSAPPQQSSGKRTQASRQAPNSRRPQQPGSRANQPQNRAAAPKPRRRDPEVIAEETSASNILWRLALILCTGFVVFCLLFSSFVGGSQLIPPAGGKGPNTPKPPVSSVAPQEPTDGQGTQVSPTADPAGQTGADASQPQSTEAPTPTPTTAPEGGSTGGMTVTGLNGQTAPQ